MVMTSLPKNDVFGGISGGVDTQKVRGGLDGYRGCLLSNFYWRQSRPERGPRGSLWAFWSTAAFVGNVVF